MDLNVRVETKNTFLNFTSSNINDVYDSFCRVRSKSISFPTDMPGDTESLGGCGLFRFQIADPPKAQVRSGMNQIASMSTMACFETDDLVSEIDSTDSYHLSPIPSETALEASVGDQSDTRACGRPRRRRRGKRGKKANKEASVIAPLADEDKTTMMLRNIPNKYTQPMMLDAIMATELQGQCDFFYLPIDFRSNCNVGYAFVNFTTPAGADKFREVFHGERMDCLNSSKVCEVSYARVQGLAANIEHYRNSPVCGLEDSELKPIIMDPATGAILPFPAPDQALQPVRPRGNCGRSNETLSQTIAEDLNDICCTRE
jgi:hypothetical protein